MRIVLPLVLLAILAPAGPREIAQPDDVARFRAEGRFMRKRGRVHETGRVGGIEYESRPNFSARIALTPEGSGDSAEGAWTLRCRTLRDWDGRAWQCEASFGDVRISKVDFGEFTFLRVGPESARTATMQLDDGESEELGSPLLSADELRRMWSSKILRTRWGPGDDATSIEQATPLDALPLVLEWLDWALPRYRASH